MRAAYVELRATSMLVEPVTVNQSQRALMPPLLTAAEVEARLSVKRTVRTGLMEYRSELAAVPADAAQLAQALRALAKTASQLANALERGH
jgi:hypothetical protein